MDSVLGRYIVVFIAIAAAVCYPAVCADAQALEDDTPRPTEDTLFEDIAVVSASRVSQPIADAPGTVSVITHDELVAMGVGTLNEAMRFVPGFDLRTSGWFQYGAFRGLSYVEDSKRVLWMIDGRPVNRVIRSDCNSGLAINVDRIEQIEIIRGPGSALYGPNAFSGVVNIITRPPGALPGNTFAFVSGNTGLWSPTVDVGWDKGKWEYGFSGMVNRWDAYQAHAINDRDFQGQDEFNLRAARGPLSISAGYSRIEEATSMSRSESATDAISHRAGWYGDAQMAWDLSESSSLSARTSIWQENEDLQMQGTKTVMHEQLSIGEVIYRAELGQQHSVVLGGEYRFQLGSAVGLGGVRPSTNRAVFLQDTITLSDGWIATVGGRYDAHSTYGNVASPRIALIRHLSERARIKVSYGEAFRAPDLSALYAEVPVTETIWIAGNPDLQPERLKTMELGFWRRTSAASYLEATLFYTKAKDLILRTMLPRPSGGFNFQSINRDAVTIYGGEISLNFISRSGNRSFINYSYEHTDYDESGLRVEFIPTHKVNAGYSLDLGSGLSATVMYNYVGSRRTDSPYNPWLGAYGVADAVVIWQAPHEIEYSLGVYNICNERYQQSYDYPNGGRTWRLRATLRH